MVSQRTMGDEKPRIGFILGRIGSMVESSRDKRATALAELRSAEEGDPFRILIGTVLSHRTRDESTSKATERLFSVYDTPQKLADADPKSVRELIRVVGFYNMKTRNVIRVAKQIVTEFGGEVPDDLESLLRQVRPDHLQARRSKVRHLHPHGRLRLLSRCRPPQDEVIDYLPFSFW